MSILSPSSFRPGTRAVAGFTLIELLIALAIVAILAVIAYPSYEEQARKTRRAEGKAALSEVASRLERCFTRFNHYDRECAPVAEHFSENGFYKVEATTLTSSTYTLQAAPVAGKAQANDTQCGTLTLTHVGVRGQTGTPPEGYKCW